MFKIPIQAAIGGRVITRETLSAMRKDGTLLPVEIMLSPMQLGGRRVTIAFVRDATEPRRRRKELEQANRRREVEIDAGLRRLVELTTRPCVRRSLLANSRHP